MPLYYWLPKKLKNPLLLVASYVFYGYWDYRFVGLLLLSTVVDFFVGRSLYNASRRKRKKQLLTLSMIVNLGILGFFKYFGFFVDSFADLLSLFGGEPDFLHINIILPVGISFYTFQTMSYTIDIYRGQIKPTRNFIDFAVFVSFFPQLVAGPIERAKNLLPQIQQKPLPSRLQIEKGIVLIVTGLFKKVMIGDTTGRFVDHIFADPQLYHSPELIVGLLLFSIQIYADFSGYSSIARGTAKLLGIELMKNFEQPYLSRNITEFWRRWHISLSSWLKDYLYISLGGNRVSKNRTYINLMLTMLLGGLWHGASWNFVIWGALHGLFLAIHKFLLKGQKVESRIHYQGVGKFVRTIGAILGTYLLVLFAWFFFRATSWDITKVFITKLIYWEPSQYTGQLVAVCLAYYSVVLAYDAVEYYTKRHTFLLQLKSKGFLYGIMTMLFITTMLFLLQSEPLPFVYFQF